MCELQVLSESHPKWFKTYENNLRRWLEEAVPIDWQNLEAQDPYGKLKRVHFEHVMAQMLAGAGNP